VNVVPRHTRVAVRFESAALVSTKSLFVLIYFTQMVLGLYWLRDCEYRLSTSDRPWGHKLTKVRLAAGTLLIRGACGQM